MRHHIVFDMSWKGLTLGIDAWYSPGTPDVMYLPNGDPGYPGDPPEVEFEIIRVEIDDPETVESELLSSGQIVLWDNALLCDAVEEYCAEDVMDRQEED